MLAYQTGYLEVENGSSQKVGHRNMCKTGINMNQDGKIGVRVGKDVGFVGNRGEEKPRDYFLRAENKGYNETKPDRKVSGGTGNFYQSKNTSVVQLQDSVIGVFGQKPKKHRNRAGPKSWMPQGFWQGKEGGAGRGIDKNWRDRRDRNEEEGRMELDNEEIFQIPGYVNKETLPFAVGEIVVNPETGTQYKLLNVLGEGTYAVVYLVREEGVGAGGKVYALKCLSCKDLTEKQKHMQDNEVRLQKQVSGHRGIVTLYSSFKYRDWLFFLMERVTGPDLYDYITQHPNFGLADRDEYHFSEALRLFEQMLESVSYLHSHGIYHRDLKPENFIMDTNGDLKLTDFGLATTLRTSVNFECGSRSYMSYENRNGGLNADDDTVYGPNQEYSPRLSDVWALGVLFLNLLFADSPWQDPCVDSCFKFCDFLRDGSRYLQIRYPKIPRKIADYLSNNIFCPERNRSSVLDFKLWIADLRASMNPSSRKPAVSNSWKVFGSHKKHNGHKHKKHQRLPEPERGHPVEIHIISPKKYSSSPHSNLYSGFPVPVAASSHAHSRSIQINPSSRSGTSSFGFPQNPIIKSNSPPVSALSSSVPAHVHSKIMPVPRPPALLAETGRSNKPAAILSSHKNISTTSPPDSFSNDCDSTLKPTSFSSGIPINSSAAPQPRPFINAHAHSDVALKSLASSVGGGVNLMGGVVGFARIREASASRSYGSSSTASFLGSSSKHRASNGSLFPTNNLHSNGSYSTKLQLSTIAASTVNSSTDSLVENLPNTLNLAMNIPNDHSLRNLPSNLSKQSPIKDTRILHPADDLFAMKLVSLNSNSSVDSLDIFDME